MCLLENVPFLLIQENLWPKTAQNRWRGIWEGIEHSGSFQLEHVEIMGGPYNHLNSTTTQPVSGAPAPPTYAPLFTQIFTDPQWKQFTMFTTISKFYVKEKNLTQDIWVDTNLKNHIQVASDNTNVKCLFFTLLKKAVVNFFYPIR